MSRSTQWNWKKRGIEFQEFSPTNNRPSTSQSQDEEHGESPSLAEVNPAGQLFTVDSAASPERDAPSPDAEEANMPNGQSETLNATRRSDNDSSNGGSSSTESPGQTTDSIQQVRYVFPALLRKFYTQPFYTALRKLRCYFFMISELILHTKI